MSFATVAPSSGSGEVFLQVDHSLSTGSGVITDGVNTINLGYGIFKTRIDNTEGGSGIGSGLINMHVTWTVQAESADSVLDNGYVGSLYDITGFQPDQSIGNVNWIGQLVFMSQGSAIPTYGKVEILLGEVYLTFDELPALPATASFSFSFIYRDQEEGTFTFEIPGFGAKSSTAIYEDFSSQADGQAISPIGDLVLGYDLDQTIGSANAKVGKAISCNFGTNTFPHDYLEVENVQSFYFACQLYLTGDTTDASIYKLGRIGAGTVYSGQPRSGDSWQGTDALPEAFVGEIVNSDGIVAYWAQNTGADKDNPGTPETIWGLNKFLLYEFIFKAGTQGVSDSYTEVRVNGKEVLLWNDQPFLTAATPDLPNWFITPINGVDGGPDLIMSMSQMYYDNGSCAAVIFTDNENYDEGTIYETQIITGSTANSVSGDYVYAEFQPGDTVHVHVRKNDGELVYYGTHAL